MLETLTEIWTHDLASKHGSGEDMKPLAISIRVSQNRHICKRSNVLRRELGGFGWHQTPQKQTWHPPDTVPPAPRGARVSGWDGPGAEGRPPARPWWAWLPGHGWSAAPG